MTRQQSLVQGALSMLESAMADSWEKYVYIQGRRRYIEVMLNRKLSMASERWQFTAAEMTRQQFMTHGVLDLVHRQAIDCGVVYGGD